MGSFKTALLPLLVVKHEMYLLQRKKIPRYKRIRQFFPESTEQILSAGFPEITFSTEMQAIKFKIYLPQKK